LIENDNEFIKNIFTEILLSMPDEIKPYFGLFFNDLINYAIQTHN